MTEYFQKNLFKDISIDEYKKLLSCLDGRTKQFKAGETICDYDEGFHEIGIIGKGTASVVRYEYNGARTILERLGPQDIFGHLLSYKGSEHAGISVVCDSPCDILFIHYATIGSPCTKSCAHHHQLTQNLLAGLKLKPQGGGPVSAHHPREAHMLLHAAGRPGQSLLLQSPLYHGGPGRLPFH